MSTSTKKIRSIANCYHCTKNEVFHSGFFQKMWPNPQFSAGLVTFTEEILNVKLHFLCSVYSTNPNSARYLLFSITSWMKDLTFPFLMWLSIFFYLKNVLLDFHFNILAKLSLSAIFSFLLTFSIYVDILHLLQFFFFSLSSLFFTQFYHTYLHIFFFACATGRNMVSGDCKLLNLFGTCSKF